MVKQKRQKFGMIEDKGDNIFYNVGEYDTFEDAVKDRNSMSWTDRKLIIVQRIDEDI